MFEAFVKNTSDRHSSKGDAIYLLSSKQQSQIVNSSISHAAYPVALAISDEIITAYLYQASGLVPKPGEVILKDRDRRVLSVLRTCRPLMRHSLPRDDFALYLLLLKLITPRPVRMS